MPENDNQQPKEPQEIEELKKEEEQSEEMGGDSQEEEGSEYSRPEQDRNARAVENNPGEVPAPSTR